MRVRKISTMYWATCIAVLLFVIYVMMMSDLSSKFPNVSPGGRIDENKWSSFESKLQNIEDELKQHHNVVGEIKSAMQQVMKQIPVKTQKANGIKKHEIDHENEVLDELIQLMPFIRQKSVKKTCPINKQETPVTDVQMLSMYETMSFVDVDGGAWKQGWDVKYDTRQWNRTNRLKVFIVPHSHNDPGWIKTFENYYKTQTRAIFQNMVEKLPLNIGRKFIWAEISYLSLWWNNDATVTQKNTFSKLLDDQQIEIVTGGWVMNDEANSHWMAIAQQLTTGHQWLIDNFNYLPANSWAIDPFGHSSSQPYLLNLAGFENSIIQRVHYRVKKELALNKNLEFRWRQLWDSTGETDMFTHMMPFYSYDVPHSCGPDPKICCQFDFKRLPGNGVNCPWGTAPLKIVTKNVRERASLILDQWRKKSQLYRSNVVLFPLGDDFRYDRSNEWTNQYENYESLIDYINNVDEWNAEVQFGTLQDYFQAVHKEMRDSSFPVLSGDFFTYADRSQHYWSGYYTTRPFHKRMDRILLAYVRAAEIITAQATTSGVVSLVRGVQLRDKLEQARRSLALFQHHDGITGTARDEVREDYAKKMLNAIKYCQSTIQQAAYYILKQPEIADQTQDDIYFDVDDIWRQPEELPTRITIALDVISPSRRLILYNALAFQRTEIVTVYVNSPHVEVYDPTQNPIMAQVAPVVSGESKSGIAISQNKFELSFPATIAPLALTTYTVSLRDAVAINKYTSFASMEIYNADYLSVNLPKMFRVEQPSNHRTDDIKIQAGKSTSVVTDYKGLIKEIIPAKGDTVPVSMKFVEYSSENGPDNHSGAYLFIPPAPAAPYKVSEYPEMVVVQGIYKSTVYSALNGPKQDELLLAVSVYDNPSLPQGEVEITNTFKIGNQNDNIELAMRLSTQIENGNTFYTDLNGMQMIKRKTLATLPIQGNVYPLPAAAYLQDARTRLTVLTSGPLGVAALEPGQIEIIQDRRLLRDDNRGLNQGILDNVRTKHTFKLIVESSNNEDSCQTRPTIPSGQLTLGAHVSQQLLLQPPVIMQYTPKGDTAPPGYRRSKYSAADIVLASFNSFVKAKHRDEDNRDHLWSGAGLIFQRVHLDTCFGNTDVQTHYPIGNGDVSIDDFINVAELEIYECSLTYTQMYQKLSEPILSLCPMEIQPIFLVNQQKQMFSRSKNDDNAI